MSRFPPVPGYSGASCDQDLSLLDRSVRLDLTEGWSRWYLLDGGFSQAGDGILTLLTENALPADSISLEEAKAQLAEAAARVTVSGEDRSRVDHDYQLALAKKSMAEMMSGRSKAN